MFFFFQQYVFICIYTWCIFGLNGYVECSHQMYIDYKNYIKCSNVGNGCISHSGLNCFLNSDFIFALFFTMLQSTEDLAPCGKNSVIMPKYKFKTKKIKVLRKTIGGGAKSSVLTNLGSDASTSAMDTGPPSSTPSGDLHEVPPFTSDAETPYRRAKRKELSIWDSIKDKMLQVSLQSAAPTSQQCSICSAQNAEYRCMECSSTSVFCETCVKTTHKNSLHLPEKWNVSIYSWYFYLSVCLSVERFIKATHHWIFLLIFCPYSAANLLREIKPRLFPLSPFGPRKSSCPNPEHENPC